MKRRNFLTGAGVAAGAALATSFPKPTIAQDKMEWKMVTSWPKGLPGLATGAERLADRIGKLSGGRLTVKVYAGGELVPAFGCFDAVSQGTAEMAHDAAYYHINKISAAGFFTSVPFGMTANELNGWIYFGGGQELWDELFAAFGVKSFLAGNTGVQMGGWFRKEIKSPKDFQGLKFRMPGHGGEALAKLGATVVQLPGAEIFGNLQSGAIDGAEWVGPYNDLSLGFYKITKLYYWPGFQEPGSALQCMVNKGKYDALPEELKQIVAAACAAENDIMLAEFNGRSPAALSTLVNEHKVELKQFPKSVLLALGTASGEVMQELIDKGDEITQRIAKSYFKFRREAKNYTKITEIAYATSRDLNFRYPQG
ncbi:TRAP transporter substrate-binding protein [Dongia soli]|uniref:TRAP transporter substrate-binding protein n=1 Tax=Dongia soli TaxID=600628 RepID=A0ABU5EAQ6_9PROT|nr:TRAP transporter substrate-binding protein [Dongia soli]MDY0883268.1 TRAP transporter substrate-binding protein [Dongia soli]